MSRVKVLGVAFDKLTMDRVLERAAGFLSTGCYREIGRPHRIVTANPELVMMTQDRPELLQLLEESDLVLADGTGVVWASRVLGNPLPERVAGFDLLLRLFELGARERWRFYFLGSGPGVADAAARQVQGRFAGVKIVGTQHGYFLPQEEEGIIAAIQKSRPDILLVALGQPRQELWLTAHLAATGACLGIGVGGSLDVLAGVARRAPLWMQKASLEWLYRLWREPRRAGRMLALPRFAWLVLRERWAGRS
ncbi:MAG: WecB/TagA/CpsF family glycosyltransferase [Firmicutes bacterium]|nr:WecB/TagA/CpsF family glycosyltransferase [Bacillota bacterium]MCL5039527.1 WecB/TagA/CpsF family glycosyltransferase [Bacillota bacterium]